MIADTVVDTGALLSSLARHRSGSPSRQTARSASPAVIRSGPPGTPSARRRP